MKRAVPWSDPVDISSSDGSSSSDTDSEADDGAGGKKPSSNFTVGRHPKEKMSEGAMIRRAEMYQEYMKLIPTPSRRASVIPFSTWQGLAKSIKQLYVKSVKRKSRAIDFEALSRHGYKGGLSVLSVPPPKEVEKQDWSWSTGKESEADKKIEESYEERQRTKAAITDGEQLANVQTRKERKDLSFSQKEKRKRDLGQASRGKNYVEEEKRQLRESGVYSGFDS